MKKSYQFQCENPTRWDIVTIDVKAGQIEATYKCASKKKPKEYGLYRF